MGHRYLPSNKKIQKSVSLDDDDKSSFGKFQMGVLEVARRTNVLKSILVPHRLGRKNLVICPGNGGIVYSVLKGVCCR